MTTITNTIEETANSINLDVPQVNIETLQSFAKTTKTQAHDIFLNPDILIPVGIIIFAFILGWIVRGILKKHLFNSIDKLKISFRTNRILKNTTKLTMHITALIVIGAGYIILTNYMEELSLSILTAASKITIAWISIRIFAQIIRNSFVRQIVATFAWIIASISILGVMNETKATLDAVGIGFGDFRLSLLTVVKSAIAFFILLVVTRSIVNVAERNLTNATDLSPSVRVLIIKIIKIILVSLAILIGITSAGIDLSALAIFGGALGLGIGFGLQKVISNLFSGMLLLVDKSIKPGDVLELPDSEGAFGWVSQLGARYVSIVTRDNKEYLIPNEDFITQPVINWSYTDRKIRVETKFGVDYNSDPHQIKALAIEIASKTKRVVSEPKPVCHLVEFGDSSLNFVLRYWIEDAENGVTNTKGDIMLGLWDAFKEHDIEIPYPHRVLIQK
jgi:small-conductance mechanosensitive channel